MNPQKPANSLADWVNEAPSIEVSATRYNQVIHGNTPQTAGFSVNRLGQ